MEQQPIDKPQSGVPNEEKFINDMRADPGNCNLFNLLNRVAPDRDLRNQLAHIHGPTKSFEEHTCILGKGDA